MEKNLGHATAYGYAKSKGYSGTEEEFAELMADYASVGQSAAESAEQAAASATSASGSATTASQAAQTATAKASDAVTAAGTATTKASEASTSADTASTAAQTATDKASEATTAASTATTKASEAAVSANTATTAKTDAETARDAAAQSASQAAASAESIDPETLEHKAYGAYVVESASGAVASFADGADSIPMKDVLVHIEPVQAGSGDPSPDNVRPITGWTGAKVTRTGKNLLYAGFKNETRKGLTVVLNDDGSATVNGTTTDNVIYTHRTGALCKDFFRAGETYTLSGGSVFRDLSRGYIQIVYIGSETGNTISIVSSNTNMTYTFAEDATLSGIYVNFKSGQTFNNVTVKPQLELGSAVTAYEPYSGDTYDITFPTEAGTVYGGTLDVTTGELVVDRAIITMDGSQLIAESQNKRFYTTIPSAFTVDVSNQATYKGVISDKFGSFSWGNLSGASIGCAPVYGKGIAFKHPDMNTVQDWNTYFTNNLTQFSYELASPVTYQLTPQEITSLLGENNLWADTGDSEVEYRADAKLYITKKITEAVSALS